MNKPFIPQDPSLNFKDVPVGDVVEGLILEDVMSYKVVPKGSASWSENIHYDNIGLATTRSAFIANGNFTSRFNTIGVPQVCYQVNQQNGAIATSSGNPQAILYWKESNHLMFQPLEKTSFGITDLGIVFSSGTNSPNLIPVFDTIQGYTIMSNPGGAGGQPLLHNGSTTAPISIDAKFPTNVNLISAGFVGRVWGAFSNSTNLYYSDVIPVSGIQNLTTASLQNVVINSGTDGITALVKTPQVLFVFTYNSIFRVFSTTSLDNHPISLAGTFNQNSVVKSRDGYYFMGPTGCYKLNIDGSIVEISQRIYTLFKLIPQSNYDYIFSWADQNSVYWNIGKLTGYDSNKYWIIKYNFVTKKWALYSTLLNIITSTYNNLSTPYSVDSTANTTSWYPAATFIALASTGAYNAVSYTEHDPSKVNQSLNGDGSNYGSSVNKNIPIKLETPWLTWEDIVAESHVKRVNGIAIPHFNAAGITVSCMIDNGIESNWINIGTLDEKATTLFRDFQSDTFNRIKFRYIGTTFGTEVKFGMPYILQLDDLKYENG